MEEAHARAAQVEHVELVGPAVLVVVGGGSEFCWIPRVSLQKPIDILHDDHEEPHRVHLLPAALGRDLADELQGVVDDVWVEAELLLQHGREARRGHREQGFGVEVEVLASVLGDELVVGGVHEVVDLVEVSTLKKKNLIKISKKK